MLMLRSERMALKQHWDMLGLSDIQQVPVAAGTRASLLSRICGVSREAIRLARRLHNACLRGGPKRGVAAAREFQDIRRKTPRGEPFS
jgi:hypothetical protein